MLRGAGRIEGWGRLDDSGACTCRLACAQRFSNHFSGADLRRCTLCPRGVSPASTWGLLRLPGSVFLRFVTVPLLTGARAAKATRAELAAKGASSYCERHLILNTTLSRECLHRLCTACNNLYESGTVARECMDHPMHFIYFRSHDPNPEHYFNS